MSKSTSSQEAREIYLFGSSEEVAEAINSILPFSNYAIYNNRVSEKRLKELTVIFAGLADEEQTKVLDFARSLKKVREAVAGNGVYAEHDPGEAIDAFIIRKGLKPPAYPKDGKIIEFLQKHYRDTGLLDGVLFTRATLRKLDPSADQALQNWLRQNDTLPDDLDIPTKKDQADRLIQNLTPEQVLAAATVRKYRQKYPRPR